MTITMDDITPAQTVKSADLREHWLEMKNRWGLGDNQLEIRFRSLYEAQKGDIKGLYAQYMWMWTHGKLWTRDRQMLNFDDGGKGTICPICNEAEESIPHLNVCAVRIKILQEITGLRKRTVIDFMKANLLSTIVTFCTLWKKRNGFFYGDLVFEDEQQRVTLENIRWELKAMALEEGRRGEDRANCALRQMWGVENITKGSMIYLFFLL
eukprot:Nk52_evm16s289 gene=Nk52_evmTU16s289